MRTMRRAVTIKGVDYTYSERTFILETEEKYEEVLRLNPKPHDELQPNQLPGIFPEAGPAVRRLIKEDTERLKEIAEFEKRVRRKLFDRYRPLDFDFMVALAMAVTGMTEERDWLTLRLARNELFIKRLKWASMPNTGKKFVDIMTLKTVPITNFITFDGMGFAKSLWVNEKHGSMYYYKKENRVWCFSSGKGGDVIDVYGIIFNCSAKEAMQALQKFL